MKFQVSRFCGRCTSQRLLSNKQAPNSVACDVSLFLLVSLPGTFADLGSVSGTSAGLPRVPVVGWWVGRGWQGPDSRYRLYVTFPLAG